MAANDNLHEDIGNIANDIKLILSHADKLSHVGKRLTIDEWREFVRSYVSTKTEGDILNDDLVGDKTPSVGGQAISLDDDPLFFKGIDDRGYPHQFRVD